MVYVYIYYIYIYFKILISKNIKDVFLLEKDGEKNREKDRKI